MRTVTEHLCSAADTRYMNAPRYFTDITNLYLQGTTEPFYLESGETVVWVHSNQDGTAIVRVRTADGFESVHDVDEKPVRSDF